MDKFKSISWPISNADFEQNLLLSFSLTNSTCVNYSDSDFQPLVISQHCIRIFVGFTTNQPKTPRHWYDLDIEV